MKPTRQDLVARLVKARAVKAEKRAAEEARKARQRAQLEANIAAPPTVKKDGFDIVKMVTSPEFLGDTDISPGQLAILKAIYGLTMTKEEMDAFLQISEGRPPDPRGYTEATIIAGTGSGKTEKILANICVFEAITFDTRVLAPGEMAVVPLVAQDERAANIALGYCEAKLRILVDKGYPVLLSARAGGVGPRNKDVVGGEIRVRENVSIRTFPCKRISMRGTSAIAGGMDEFAHWRTEPNAYNSDREIQRAFKGRRRAHTPNLRLVKITSPFGEEGVAWEDYQERNKARRLFVQAPTWVLNPKLSREALADEELEDADAFARERGAQFGKVGGSFIPGALVDACTRLEPKERPPTATCDYRAALDVAYKGDLYACAVAHAEGETKVVFDAIWWKQGSKLRPLDDDEVALEMGEFMRGYGIDRVIGDQFADVPTKKAYRNLGIEFLMEPQTAASNMQMFKNLKAAMRRRMIELPPDPMIRKDLTSLIQTKLPGSPIWRCAAPDRSGMHDDIAKVVALLTLKLMPAVSTANLEELNRGAVADRERLFKERGFTLPEDPERLPTNIMGQVY